MKDYPMLFESLVLSAWGKKFRREDPLKMGDADTLGLVGDNLGDRNGHNAKFALSAAMKKVAVENEGTAVYSALISLDESLWNAKKYNEFCQVLGKAKILFESVGIIVV